MKCINTFYVYIDSFINLFPCNFLMKQFYVILAIGILFFFKSLIHHIHSDTLSLTEKTSVCWGRAWRRRVHRLDSIMVVHLFLKIIFLYYSSTYHRFTSSPGEKIFQVKISAPDEQFTRVGVQVLDRKDGSFIVRYRMYASYKNLKVEVKFQGQHVAKSPYILKGNLEHNFKTTSWIQWCLSFNIFFKKLAWYFFSLKEKNRLRVWGDARFEWKL